MNYYIELTLLPDSETSLYFLWEKVYQQLHLAFATIKNDQLNSPIGVAFPRYDLEKYQLGEKLRLFAETDNLLERLNAKQWLANLSDYVHLTSIKPVPNKIKKYGSFYRVYAKSYVNRAKRRAKLANISIEQALHFFADRDDQWRTHTPYLHLKSHTNGERFRLFIGYLEQPKSNQAVFSCYGLSRNSTVPIF